MMRRMQNDASILKIPLILTRCVLASWDELPVQALACAGAGVRVLRRRGVRDKLRARVRAQDDD
jgi:hypothetical protein